MINVQIKKNGFYVNNLEGDNFYVNVRTGVIKVAVECTHGIGWVDIKEWFDPLQVTGIVTIICNILDEIGE